MAKLRSIYEIFLNGILFTFTNSPSVVWGNFNSRECLPFYQFTKYALCGCAAFVSHNTTQYLIGRYLIPAYGPEAEALSDSVRGNNLMLCNIIAFPIGNFVAYFSNALWVFTGGRHSRKKEFMYFTLISITSGVVGLFAIKVLVNMFGVPSWQAQTANVLVAVMVNFICRKLFVFSK